jgi:putative tricarboxylic transport membrane protein
VLCFFLRRNGFPVAPFVLGIVLGDIVDKSLRRGLVISDGDLTPFFSRPIAGVLAVIVLLTVLLQFHAVRRIILREV